MDRKLTEKEQIEYRKQVGNLKQANRRHSVPYRRLILLTMVILFLYTPKLFNSGLDAIGLNWQGQETSPPVKVDEAIIRVYAARTWGAKGVLAVHSWIAMKRTGSADFEVSQIIGWRQDRRGNVLFRETGVPVDSWWGNPATLLLEHRGEDVASIIDKVDAAIKAYPWSKEYTLYPGPNSNTFVAWIGLQVPELGLDLPSKAIGKDWRPFENSLGRSASGSGVQVSFLGFIGTSIGFEEGLEVNVLGLSFELDLFDLALELPLFGRYPIWYLMCYLAVWYFLVRKWIRVKSRQYAKSSKQTVRNTWPDSVS